MTRARPALAPLVIARGFAESERAAAAALFWAAFSDKLGRLLAPEARALAFVATALRPDHALCARDAQGRLVGLAGIKTATGGLVEAGYPELRAVYGRLGGLWRGLLLDLTERPVLPGEMLLDGLCVAPGMRGQGVGSALIAALVAEARGQGVVRIRLDVIDRNPRARALYLRHGFVPCGRRRMGALRHVYGFRAAERMELRP